MSLLDPQVPFVIATGKDRLQKSNGHSLARDRLSLVGRGKRS
jgi:hypothetical protein